VPLPLLNKSPTASVANAVATAAGFASTCALQIQGAFVKNVGCLNHEFIMFSD